MKQKGTNSQALEILFHHMYLLLNILRTYWPIGVEAADHSKLTEVKLLHKRVYF